MRVTLDASNLSTQREAQLVAAILATQENVFRLEFNILKLHDALISVANVIGAKTTKALDTEADLETYLVRKMRDYVAIVFPDLRILIESEPTT